jgi:hypothetical protein
MARLPIAANTEGNNETLDDFSPVPAGDYIAMITKSEYKETKAKNGHYLQLMWKIISGEKKGRVLFDNLNLDNPNEVAVNIANKALNSICKACDKVGVQDSEELHGIPVKLTVAVQQATATNPASNNIRAYSAAEGADEVAVPDVGDGADSEDVPVQREGKKSKLPWE